MKRLSPTLKNLVALLNDGKFHSGSELGERLKISRNAVRKQINGLIEAGINIECLQSKGYCLKQPLELLDAKRIRKYFDYSGTLKLGDIDIYRSLASTNDHLRNKATQNARLIHVCLAEQQTAGKGRLGRNWHSPFGRNIYLSCLWQYDRDISELSGLSLIIGLSIIETLITCDLKQGITVKWPNDILFEGKKLAGTLIEIQAESHSNSRVIIGIGINVNMLEEMESSWTSLAKIKNEFQDRNKIAGVLLNHVIVAIDKFLQEGFTSFKKSWQKYDYLKEASINLSSGLENFSGIAKGINEYGHLLLQHADGRITHHSSGDSSLKKKIATN